MSNPSPSVERRPLVQHPSPLVAVAGERRTSVRRSWLAALGLLAVLAVLGGLAWRVLAAPAPVADGFGALAAVELTVPLGASGEVAERVGLRLEPMADGRYAVAARLANDDGTPAAGRTETAPTLAATRIDAPAAADPAGQPEPDRGAGLALPTDGWWRVEAAIDGATGAGVPFYLLRPDPNVAGSGAIETPAGDEAARALYERGLAALTGLHRVRFSQWNGDGNGNGSVAEHAINDGADGQPPAFTYRALGGLDAVVIGERRWIRQPDGSWLEQPSNPMVPPREWGEEYAGATGFRLGIVEPVGGEPSQVVTFVVPAQADPYQAPAWYAWWVGLETGQLRREAMVSRNHYMLNEFRDFDAPLPIVPPPTAQAG